MSKILIIDDDEQVVMTLKGIIDHYFPEANIWSAYDGMEGIQLVRTHKPDLIILDINLPSVSGHAICRSLKSDPELKKTPILIVTGEHSETTAKVKSLEYGAEAFLNKPFDVPELAAQVKSLLRLKEAEDKLLLERDLLKIDVRVKEKELEKNYRDIKRLFRAFIEVMATSIDALSIYNYDSTRKVAEMVKNFIDYININNYGFYRDLRLDKEKQDNLITAAWLHDIGKISIPTNLMNKFTRLGDHYPVVLQRLEAIYYYLKAESDKNGLREKCLSAIEIVQRLNIPVNKVAEEDISQVNEFANLTYRSISGEERTWFTEEETEALLIMKGTLTEKERKEVENHVQMTDLLLSKMPFAHKKRDIPKWCRNHHELLDGSGYHQGLKGEQISTETRILTIVDIFEALTSCERPYKKYHTIDEALYVIEDMAEKGKLDKELVRLFKESKAWEIEDEEKQEREELPKNSFSEQNSSVN